MGEHHCNCAVSSKQQTTTKTLVQYTHKFMFFTSYFFPPFSVSYSSPNTYSSRVQRTKFKFVSPTVIAHFGVEFFLLRSAVQFRFGVPKPFVGRGPFDSFRRSETAQRPHTLFTGSKSVRFRLKFHSRFASFFFRNSRTQPRSPFCHRRFLRGRCVSARNNTAVAAVRPLTGTGTRIRCTRGGRISFLFLRGQQFYSGPSTLGTVDE